MNNVEDNNSDVPDFIATKYCSWSSWTSWLIQQLTRNYSFLYHFFFSLIMLLCAFKKCCRVKQTDHYSLTYPQVYSSEIFAECFSFVQDMTFRWIVKEFQLSLKVTDLRDCGILDIGREKALGRSLSTRDNCHRVVLDAMSCSPTMKSLQKIFILLPILFPNLVVSVLSHGTQTFLGYSYWTQRYPSLGYTPDDWEGLWNNYNDGRKGYQRKYSETRGTGECYYCLCDEVTEELDCPESSEKLWVDHSVIIFFKVFFLSSFLWYSVLALSYHVSMPLTHPVKAMWPWVYKTHAFGKFDFKKYRKVLNELMICKNIYNWKFTAFYTHVVITLRWNTLFYIKYRSPTFLEVILYVILWYRSEI